MSSSLREGLVVAHPVAGDAARVLSTLTAFDQRLLGSSDWTLEELQSDWRDVDLGNDVWMVLDEEKVVGYLALGKRNEDWEFDGYVHPDHFGEGIGGLLVELGEGEARKRGSRVTRTGVLGSDEAAHRLLEGRGFREVRRYYRMKIHLTERPEPPAWPERLLESPVDFEAQHEEIHAAIDEAFAEHWNFAPMEHEKWVVEQRERDRIDPRWWVVVRERDEVAGVLSLDRERFGTGWVGIVAVRKPWRRRGLGEAMLVESFQRLWDAGQREVGLGVDAQNVTGATRLYERVGMEVDSSATFFEKTL